MSQDVFPKAEVVAIDSVAPDPDNVREHPAQNLAALRSTLSQHGQLVPLVLYEDVKVDGKPVIKKGNATWRLLQELGWSEVWVTYGTFKDAQDATAWAILDNRLGELSTWKHQGLVAQLRALTDLEDFDEDAVGFSAGQLDKLLGLKLELDTPDLDDDGAPPPVPPPDMTAPRPAPPAGGLRMFQMFLSGDDFSDLLARRRRR